ncbi:hypothetical protein ASE71_10580 [Ensifer sp. Root954]|nr:hypothetical protein ASE71_10580 [Ensifer sp. Root954]
MATDIEKLVVQLSADINSYKREMQRAAGITNAQARAIENRFRGMHRRLDTIGRSSAQALIAPLTGIAAVLSVREVAQYADAWTTAKNSLAVAGVVGDRQADVLERLYQSAQANAAPVGALADLFGKAAQASDNLGASQQDLLRFSDGVATALRVSGTSATEASGALTQLGQLLGSARVQAEEFNLVNDGARPILMAVAAGLDAAGGSVNKLKQLVNDGKVSGQQFFQAFLRGLPQIQSMASNATQTIDQGLTKVRNAFTKYIGETDSSLGASARLVDGLNALADNFDKTADITLKFAGILAGALVGRSIAGMIATIPNAASAVIALTTAMRAGSLSAAGFSAALGPLGLILGAVTGAVLIFRNWKGSIDDATRSLAEQATTGEGVQSMIADVQKAQDAYKVAIAQTAGAQSSATSSIVADTKKEFEAKKSLLELEMKRQQALVAVSRASLAEKSAALRSEVGGSVNVDMGRAERGGFSDPRVGRFVGLPDDITGLEKTRDVIAKSPLSAEIQKLRAEIDLAEISTGKLNEALSTTFSDNAGGKAAGGGASDGKGGGAKKKADEYQTLTDRIAEATAATIAETDAQRALNPTIEDYGYALEKARTAHELLTAATASGLELTPKLRAEIDTLADAYANATAESGRLADSQDEIRQRAQEATAFQRDMAQGIVSSFLEGKKAADVFADALTNISNRLLDLAFDDLFPRNGNSGGAIIGGTFSLNIRRPA